MAKNFRELVANVSASWMLDAVSQGWWGVLVGLIHDVSAEAWSLVLRMPWLADAESPDDVVPIVAKERRLRRYSLETAAAHRARVLDAWNAYAFAGAGQTILQQLDLAGYPGAALRFFTGREGPRQEPGPYWSQFWVYWPIGTHPVTGDAPAVGSFVVGSAQVGVVGVDPDYFPTVRGIIRKWKPVDWYFRGFVFQISTGLVVGSFVVGSTTVIGGEIETV